MPGCRSGVAAAVALVAALSLPGPVAATEDPTGHRVLFSFEDERIDESSGLVDRGDLMFTVNDSGDGPVVYAVDPRSGATVADLTYSREPVSDVEAIALGPEGVLWVADIGDNDAERPYVEVHRVRVPERPETAVAPGERFRLSYPDGPRDAEALLVHPRTGRLYVVSKGILGGTVYAAPPTLAPDRVNRLREVGRVPGVVTDGAFLPDGSRLLLRGYGSAAAYDFPGLGRVAGWDLPEQEQGEAIAVRADGRVSISSEGVHSEVLAVRMPGSMRERPASAPTPSAAATPDGETADPASSRPEDGRGGGVWWRVGATGAGVVAVVALLLRASRRRSPRRR